MFGTLAHPTPMSLFLWAIWIVANWRIAPPVSWMRLAVAPAESTVQPRAFEPR